MLAYTLLILIVSFVLGWTWDGRWLIVSALAFAWLVILCLAWLWLLATGRTGFFNRRF